MAQSNPFCTSCGSALRSGASFCGKCGTTIEQGYSNPQPAYKNPRQEAFEEYENDYVGRAWVVIRIHNQDTIIFKVMDHMVENLAQLGGCYQYFFQLYWRYNCLGVGVKDRDPRMAKNCLILGIILTVVPFAIGMLFVFIGAFLPVQDNIQPFDMYR